jgi:hypothetical protein
VVDVPVAAHFFSKDNVFQGKTVVGPRHVLDWYFHGTEFVEFVVFDVLISCLRGGQTDLLYTWRGAREIYLGR